MRTRTLLHLSVVSVLCTIGATSAARGTRREAASSARHAQNAASSLTEVRRPATRRVLRTATVLVSPT